MYCLTEEDKNAIWTLVKTYVLYVMFIVVSSIVRFLLSTPNPDITGREHFMFASGWFAGSILGPLFCFAISVLMYKAIS